MAKKLNYTIAADLVVLASAYYKKGQKKDAVKLFVRAMDESDSEEVIDYLDEVNQNEMEPANEENEVLSDEEIDEVLQEEETPIAEEPEMEPEVEAEGEDEIVQDDEDLEEIEMEPEAPVEEPEELPALSDVIAAVEKRKVALANLKSLSGNKEARKAAIAKLLKK